MRRFIVLSGLCALAFASVAHAATVVTAPSILSPSGNSVAYNAIDATQQTGIDMCAKISAAVALVPASQASPVIVDARGFTGVQACAGSMWTGAVTNSTGRILLGNVSIQTAVPQNPPSQWSIQGITPYSLDAPTFTAIGTVIQPANSNSFVVSMTKNAGTTSSGSVLTLTTNPVTAGVLTGDSVVCTGCQAHTTVQSLNTTSVTMGEPVSGSVAGGATITFTHPIMSLSYGVAGHGVQTSALRISCIQPNGTLLTGGIGWQNDAAQQNSPSKDIVVDGCYTDFDVEQVGSIGPYNGGPYDRFAANFNGNTTAAPIGIKIGNGTTLLQTESNFDNFSCNGANDSTEPTLCALIDGQTSFITPNVENTVTGFEIASLRGFGGLSIISPICSGGNFAMTTCIHISANQNMNELAILDIQGFSGDGVTNRIVDSLNSRTITNVQVSHYLIGRSGSIIADGAPNLVADPWTFSSGISLQSLALSATAPTIASGGCTGPAVTNSNGVAAFKLTIGSSCSGVSAVVLTMPAAANGWACSAQDITSNATNSVAQSAQSTTSVTLTSYSRTAGTALAWTAGDVVVGSCVGY